jgi:hypothetical protein
MFSTCRFLRGTAVLPLLLIMAAPAYSQSPKIVLVPGLGETADNWALTAGALGSSLQVGTVTAVTLYSTAAKIQDQTTSLTSSYSSELGLNSIILGHSNGGLVTRFLAQHDTMLGTATIGSPNYGLPAVVSAAGLIDFAADMLYDGLVTAGDFAFGDDYWVFDYYFYYAWDDFWYFGGQMEAVEDYAGLNDAVARQDSVSSPFLDDTLNASGNVTTELANATTSVAVVVTPENWYYGGPMRLISGPSGALSWHYLIETVSEGLYLGAAYVLDNNYPMTGQTWAEYDDLSLLAILVGYIEQVWCSGVSVAHFVNPWTLTCFDNDGFVGTSFQARPSVTSTNWDGGDFAHLEETLEADLYVSLLHVQFSVPF